MLCQKQIWVWKTPTGLIISQESPFLCPSTWSWNPPSSCGCFLSWGKKSEIRCQMSEHGDQLKVKNDKTRRWNNSPLEVKYWLIVYIDSIYWYSRDSWDPPLSDGYPFCSSSKMEVKGQRRWWLRDGGQKMVVKRWWTRTLEDDKNTPGSWNKYTLCKKKGYSWKRLQLKSVHFSLPCQANLKKLMRFGKGSKRRREWA